uniref:HAT C-terminal dimerisation domain-containing protein n=2 Tax=Ditylenchus dipsaci TaxID=166011 RepID=A0A915ELP6_9BILA
MLKCLHLSLYLSRIHQAQSALSDDGKDIAKLALEILAITGTNTPVERVFSQCGLATARHRNRTNCQLLDSQLIVYLNSYCYEK